jgi:DNA-binding response OmpR family regulator
MATRTVLLVDDDVDILQGMRVVIESRGYRVLTATDGNSGLALAEKEQPDVVVVDMMMPKKSGFLVLERLKSRKQNAPRVIMITANEGGRHRAYAEMLGVDDYIRKPFAMERLLESIERALPVAGRRKRLLQGSKRVHGRCRNCVPEPADLAFTRQDVSANLRGIALPETSTLAGAFKFGTLADTGVALPETSTLPCHIRDDEGNRVADRERIVLIQDQPW